MRWLLLVLALAGLAAAAWLVGTSGPSEGDRAEAPEGADAEGDDQTAPGDGVQLESGARVRRNARVPQAAPGKRGGAAPSPAPEVPARMPGGVAHLTLEVRAADGTPIPRAEVNVFDAQGARHARIVDGRLEVALRELDGRLVVQVLNPRTRDDQPLDAGWGTLELMAARAGASVALALPRGARVAGQVVDDLGAPVVGANVLVRPSFDVEWARGGARVDATRRTTTDTNGRFAVEGLGEGHVLVEALPLPTLQRGVAVAVAPGTENVRFVLARAADAGVRVVDARGEPVAKARVSATRVDGDPIGLEPLRGVVETDAEGAGRVPHLDPERAYMLRVEPPQARSDLQRAEIAAWRPEPLTTVRLETGRTVRGRVVDTRGAPYPEARAYWRQGTRWSTLALQPDGTFVAGGLEAGSVTLRASSSPDALHQPIEGLATFMEVTVAVGRDDVELRVVRGQRLGVTLSGWPTDAGFRTGQLHAYGLAGGRTWHVAQPVREGGALHFDGLEPEGTYAFWFAPGGGDLYALRDGLRADAGHVDVPLQRGVAIRGRIELPAGANAALVQATLRDRPFTVDATPEADGRFVLRGVPPDTRWRVVAAFSEGVQRRSVVTEDVAAGSDLGTLTPR